MRAARPIERRQFVRRPSVQRRCARRSHAVASAFRHRSASARSSCSRVRAPLTKVSDHTRVAARVCNATCARCSPRFGDVVARLAVQPKPKRCATSRSSSASARWNAAIARSHAVSTLHACSGLAPMNSASARSAYGTRASSTVFDAPGTASRSANNIAPPPVTANTPKSGSACSRSTIAVRAFMAAARRRISRRTRSSERLDDDRARHSARNARTTFRNASSWSWCTQ